MMYGPESIEEMEGVSEEIQDPFGSVTADEALAMLSGEGLPAEIQELINGGASISIE